jgi:IS30 family transposase
MMSEGKAGYKHIDFEARCDLEKYLNAGMNLTWISKKTGSPLSTLSREVKRNRRDDGCRTFTKTTHICALRKKCNIHALCKTKCYSRRCSTCPGHLCTVMCGLYQPEVCKRTMRAPYCCNGCMRSQGCLLHRFRYDARGAQSQADTRLKGSREGINCTEEELTRLVDLAKPMLKAGLGLDAIWITHKDEIALSQRTFYRYVEMGLGGLCNMDLPKKVTYKPRKVVVKRQRKRDLTGHTYKDFCALDEEVRLSAFEMDCVEGVKDDTKVILTFLLKRFHFQFGILLERHDTASVIAAFDWLEDICEGRFAEVFATILTDRGHEFSDIDGMETGGLTKKRTSVYFCDPCRPNQKGQCEKSHVEVRKIIPKGTSFANLTPYDIATIFSHINSVPRKSLGGASPLALAKTVLPKSLLEGLGLSIILPLEIILKPSLLDNTKPAE